MIPYGKQDIQKEDIDAVIDVLRSDFLTQGPIVPRFENGLANIGKSKYATVVNSATSALHIACLSLGVGEGDYVWTVPNSFVASANCALYCGATVDFVDIDVKTSNISIEKLEEKLICLSLLKFVASMKKTNIKKIMSIRGIIFTLFFLTILNFCITNFYSKF